MFLCFIHYKKAFDYVRWKGLWTVLSEMGVPSHLMALINNLYGNNAALVNLMPMVNTL